MNDTPRPMARSFDEILSAPGTSEIPLIGFERNEPFRRILGVAGREIPIERLDPGVVYHYPEGRVARPASVEGWIEAFQVRHPGPGARDFWEEIWNLSVCAWNLVDTFGREPWRPPQPLFPYSTPKFWQGLDRNRLLFLPTASYLHRFSMDGVEKFALWVDANLRFVYGEGIETVPTGMAALALNAPSESYLLKGDGASAPPSSGDNGAFRLSVKLGESAPSGPIHQIFFDPPLDCLAAQTVVLTRVGKAKGSLFARFSEPCSDTSVRSLQERLDDILGSGWGEIDSVEPRSSSVEAVWPWLGPVRKLISC